MYSIYVPAWRRRAFLRGCRAIGLVHEGLKIKTEAIDGNLSSTLIRPHRGRGGAESRTERGRNAGEKGQKLARPKEDTM